MNIEYANSPVSNEDGSINLMVKFKEFDTEVPFTASASDPAPHGKMLYENALNGEYDGR